jgi:hypothetical protein
VFCGTIGRSGSVLERDGVGMVGDKDSAAELKRRADTLRDAARRARTAAAGLGPYLDGPAKKASATGADQIWKGPWAESTTSTLRSRSSTLQTMATDLLADAKRWGSEADKLDERAKQAGKDAH